MAARRLVFGQLSEQNFSGELVNIACGNTHSVLDVLHQVEQTMGEGVMVRSAPPRLGDQPKSWAAISRAQDLLSYNPMVQFEQGMHLTGDWWKGGCSTDYQIPLP